MKNRSWTFLILYYWGKIIGLNPLTLTKTNKLKFSYLSLFYAFVLSAVNSYIWYQMAIVRAKMVFPGDSPVGLIVEFIGIFSGCLETILTWLTFGFCQNRIRNIINSFANVHETSKKLGIQGNYEKYFRNLGFHTILVNGCYIFWMMLNNSTSAEIQSDQKILLTMLWIIRIASCNMAVLYLWSLNTVKQKFHQLDDEIRSALLNDSKTELPPRTTEILRRNYVVFSDKIKMFSQLHRQLGDSVHRIQEHFAVFFALYTLGLLSNITIDVHIIYRFLKEHSGPFTASDVAHGVHIGAWIVIPIITLVGISNICGSLCDAANGTGNILHSTWNLRDDSGNTGNFARIYFLSLDLLQRRMKISLLGCMELDYSFVYRVLAMVTTYLTIMLQFNN